MSARSGEEWHTDEVASGQEFAAALDDLKHTGCFLLVTGDVDDPVRIKQTQHLFGDPAIDRERVLVLTNTTRTRYSDYLPHGMAPDHPSVHLVDYREPLRSDTVTETRVGKAGRSPDASEQVQTDGLDDLNETITDTIAPIRERPMPLAASELRVCLTDLSVLLDRYGVAATTSFVRTVGKTVRAARGMGFCYLSVANDDPVIGPLSSQFDVHIELRESVADPARHRWYLPDYELASEWIPV